VPSVTLSSTPADEVNIVADLPFRFTFLDIAPIPSAAVASLCETSAAVGVIGCGAGAGATGLGAATGTGLGAQVWVQVQV
jgi:hypothetical protein